MNWGGPEEILEWLCREVETAVKHADRPLSPPYNGAFDRIDYDEDDLEWAIDQFNEQRAEMMAYSEAVGERDALREMRSLVTEARQRLKESKQVAA